MRMWLRILCIGLALCTGFVRFARADDDGTLNFLRDAEVEHTLRLWMTPIWKAAGLNPDSVHVYVVNDPRLNSFVAAGQNITDARYVTFIGGGQFVQTDFVGRPRTMGLKYSYKF